MKFIFFNQTTGKFVVVHSLTVGWKQEDCPSDNPNLIGVLYRPQVGLSGQDDKLFNSFEEAAAYAESP